MQIHLSPRHLTLTASIHSYVADKITHLEEISSEIVAAHVVLIHDKKTDPAEQHCIKVHLAIPGKDIHAQDVDADLYAAIDKVTANLARQLRKRKTKIQDKPRHDLQVAREKERMGVV